MKSPKRLAGIILIIICLVFLSACGQRDNNSEPDTAEVFEEYQNKIFAFGVVKAEHIFNVTIDFPASLEKNLVKDGAFVTKGDVLAVLNIDDYNLEVSRKQREINMERIELLRLETNLSKISNDLKYAQGEYNAAVEELKHNETLYKEGAITKAELDNYYKAVDEKEKNVKNLELSLGNSQDSVPEVQLQKQKIALLESGLANMQNKLIRDYINGTNIISNVEKGVVYEMNYWPGDSIVSGKKLFSIIDLDSIVIEADVSEEFIGEISVGARATITPLADRSKVFHGTVLNIAGRAMERKGETIVPVDISIENNDYFLLPGFNVDVEIEK